MNQSKRPFPHIQIILINHWVYTDQNVQNINKDGNSCFKNLKTILILKTLFWGDLEYADYISCVDVRPTPQKKW